eukprot:3474889-Pyramimonas_sp.AAC.1
MAAQKGWGVGLSPVLLSPLTRPGLDRNGVLAISWAVFVSIPFCGRGGLKTKRGKTKTERKQKTPLRFSPA